MDWTLDHIPDLTGQVAVVLEPDCSRGLSTVRHLVGHNAHVVMVARNVDALAAGRLDVLSEWPDAVLSMVTISDVSPAGCVEAARAVLQLHPRVDLLVNNSCPGGQQDDPDNGRSASTSNATGLYAFTAALMPGLLLSHHPRIVTIVRDGDPASPTGGRPASELALGVTDFTLELHQQLSSAHSTVQSMAADLAMLNCVGTQGSSGGSLERRIARQIADRDAAPELRAATDPAATGGGLYTPTYAPGGPPVRLPMPPATAGTRQRWDAATRRAGIALTPVPQLLAA